MPQFGSHDTAVFGDSLADQVVLQGVEPGHGWHSVQRALTGFRRTTALRCPPKSRGSLRLSHWHRERRRGFPSSIRFIGLQVRLFQMMATRHRSIPGSCKIMLGSRLRITSRRRRLHHRHLLQSWRRDSNRPKAFSPGNYHRTTRERSLSTNPSYRPLLPFLFPGLVQLRRISK